MKATTHKAVFIATAISLAACTMEGGELVEEHKGRTMVCTDTRDGETFLFSTDNITSFRSGLLGAPSSFDVVLDSGKEVTLSSDMEAWLKCEALDQTLQL